MHLAFIIDPMDGNGFVVAVGVGKDDLEAIQDLRKQAASENGIPFNTYSEGAGSIDTLRLAKIIDAEDDEFTFESFRKD